MYDLARGDEPVGSRRATETSFSLELPSGPRFQVQVTALSDDGLPVAYGDVVFRVR